MAKTISIDLSSKSIQNAINELKKINKNILMINDEFIIASLTWIMNRANEYLAERVKSFPNSANISKDWEINKLNEKANYYELRNVNDKAYFVEFGTGLKGSRKEHPMAEETNYVYDVNSYGEKGWDFDFQYDGKWYHFRGYTGYEGKSFLYDATWDYIHLGEYKKIFENVCDKYLK